MNPYKSPTEAEGNPNAMLPTPTEVIWSSVIWFFVILLCGAISWSHPYWLPQLIQILK